MTSSPGFGQATDQPWLPEDLRHRASAAIQGRRETLASDLDVLVGAALPVSAEARGRLVTRVLDLLARAIGAGSVADSPAVIDLARVEETGAKLVDLFAVVRLAERSILQELSVDAQLGATTEHWPAVSEMVRQASFDLLAVVCTRRAANASQSVIDPITTLVSRAVFDIAVSTELQRATRYGHPISLILFDLDDLKTINNTHGYGVGDRVLERLGVFMRQFFRQTDWVGRYGDDSIAALLPETDAAAAYRLAEGAREAVQERLVFADKQEHPVGITVTAAVVGVTLREDAGEGRLLLDSAVLMAEAESGVRRGYARGGNTTEVIPVVRESLSLKEAAAALGCSTGALRRLIAAGTLRAVEVGRHLRLDRAAVEAFARRNPRHAKKPAG